MLNCQYHFDIEQRHHATKVVQQCRLFSDVAVALSLVAKDLKFPEGHMYVSKRHRKAMSCMCFGQLRLLNVFGRNNECSEKAFLVG